MSKPQPTIENLMKVSVNIDTQDEADKDAKGAPFEFIFGVGSAGITPFEKALFGKSVGDSIHFDIAPTEFCQTVGHLELPLREQTGIMTPIHLQVTITDIVRAQDREVVQAMATGGSCSDCGCGCGGH